MRWGLPRRSSGDQLNEGGPRRGWVDRANDRWGKPWSRLPLLLYVAILVLYSVLIGWWVYFFSRQHDRLIAQFDASGAALTPSQVDVLRDVTAGHVRMFLSEGLFLGLLLLGSIALIVRAVRQEAMLYRQQRNFLSAVTHELNTPLTSAKLHLESLLLGRTDADKTERYLRHTLQDLNRLGDMVSDVLATGRLVSERTRLDLETFDLAALVARRAQRVSRSEAFGPATVDTDAAKPVFVEADRAAIEKVIDNLVSNAVKYGGDSPALTLRVSAEDNWAILAVRDFGPGLQGADPVKILEPFVRGQDENVRTRPGAGLGLYIVDEFVKAHGGTVRIVDGIAGGGTIVVVRLPLAHARGAGAESLREAV